MSVTARYVIFTVNAVKGTTERLCQLSEFVLQLDAVDISMTGATVTSNVAGIVGSEGPDKLVDASTATKYCSVSSTGPWIFTIDLGTEKTFNGYRWATANDEAGRDPTVFTLHTSVNGTDYILRSEVTDTVTDTRLTYVGPYSDFYYPKNSISPNWVQDTLESAHGVTPVSDDDAYGGLVWQGFQDTLERSVLAGKTFSTDIVSTYSLVYTGNDVYIGGVLAPNGDIHFVPREANRGQKVSASGVVSTYSLVYTTTSAYWGGVLAPNGDIHFVPFSANRGQKINANGVVSTYNLIYTRASAYLGGVLAPNGDIHFVPRSAAIGQKIVPGPLGGAYTYTLIYTTTDAYSGGVLAPNGDIHFVPRSANRGQKISAAGVVSTYSLVYSNSGGAYKGGVLAPNGDIHFIPANAVVGQKVSPAGVVSTYSLVYTLAWAYLGGVLAPNGDIHFIPANAVVGQKVSASGVVSTYSLPYTAGDAYSGGVLAPNGDIYFVPRRANRGQILHTNSARPFDIATCASPFLNKL